MNPNLDKVQPYPFQKLQTLKNGLTPPTDKRHIAFSIGEPKHTPPKFVLDCLDKHRAGYANYPITKGTLELRQTICNWLSTRFNIESDHLDADLNVIPVNGTREALFAFAQSIVNSDESDAMVLMPNPFYQIYEGAALIGGASPYFLNCTKESGFIPAFKNVSSEIWEKCQLLYICSPGNPTGAVLDVNQLTELIELADKYDFIIAGDECYSELYYDDSAPPIGLLETCSKLGRHSFDRCIVFHSLSKRSNLPGLRSGFVAGDASILERFLTYRTYHGCAMPLPIQQASIAAWSDESHVVENRRLYAKKFEAVLAILKEDLNVTMPEAGFYLWPQTPIRDTDFSQMLFAQQNVTVLPGSFLARNTDTGNPGENHIRIALVASLEDCIEGAHRIRAFTQSLQL